MNKDKAELKQIAVWMDHSEALLVEPADSAREIRVIQSSLETRTRIKGERGNGTRLGSFRSANNEYHKHNKKQNETLAYYKKLAEQLLPFTSILIFGPSTAHDEFHNYLAADKKFSDKKIVFEKADYISENQIKEKVRTFFKSDVKI